MMIELIYGIDIEKVIGNFFYVYLIFMIFDIITGLLRAGKDRKINSSINFEGLIRKMGGLVGVVFLTFIDLYLNTNGVVTKAGVGALIIYETLSITENFKRIGINVDLVMKYFEEEKFEEDNKK